LGRERRHSVNSRAVWHGILAVRPSQLLLPNRDYKVGDTVTLTVLLQNEGAAAGCEERQEAAVGCMTMNDSPPPKSRLRWYQFRLRTLLVFVLLCAAASSWFAVKWRRAKEAQARRAEAVRTLGVGCVGSATVGPRDLHIAERRWASMASSRRWRAAETCEPARAREVRTSST
jgi:hypothetical protein